MTQENTEKLENDKRTLILSSAFHIFSEYGYHEAKMEQIAKHAGVGKGTLYLYFATKEELMREMLKNVIAKYNEYVKDQMEEQVAPLDKLKALYTAHIELLKKNSHFTKFSINEFSFVNNELRDWLEDIKKGFIEDLRLIYQNGVQQQQFREMNEEIAISIMFALITSIFSKDIIIEVEQVDQLLDVLKHGLAKP